jgi:hypothetical protein
MKLNLNKNYKKDLSNLNDFGIQTTVSSNEEEILRKAEFE